MDSTAVNNHKVATILQAVKDGLSPSETAAIFLKHAEVLNACSDCIVREKQAIFGLDRIGITMPAWQIALLPVAAAAGGSYLLGSGAGRLAADTLTPVSEVSTPTYQKAEEILRTKNETARILDRVAAKKKKDAERSNDRSVRSIF